jgi:dihydrofolate reductase
MTQVILDITMSVDGFVAGPNASLDEPLGERGIELHEWIFPLRTWRAHHGLEGGEGGDDDELVARGLATIGAGVMGRGMFSGGRGPWEDDPNAGGWWGDEPPFGVPMFVVTHHPREPVAFANGTVFTFVDGVEAAVAQAREAASGRDVRVGGGASVATQALRAGLLDRIDLHVAPLLLGSGVKLFDGAGPAALEIVETLASPRATHVSYRVNG